ncbi:GNAT family N-acetyltransferase [Lysinibacillus telephonicus]|uniref:GNAT family N-acetyltransferase n=3 Tax=Lysinibacillus telephonicus TaxID=1714840 RepID=A0A3S0JT19_9BACI|nr:GNAT family N-acetyltransferase [Lysinibacillus telephonicus]
MPLVLKVVNCTSEDESFMYKLFVSTRIQEFTLLHLSEKQIQSLLKMQYDAQKNSFHTRFPNATYEMIYLEGVRIGRMITDKKRHCIHLVDISLLPEYRGKGYGTEIIKTIQKVAIMERMDVTLYVLQGNPAQNLYERCGFYVIEKVDPYLAMRFDVVQK